VSIILGAVSNQNCRMTRLSAGCKKTMTHVFGRVENGSTSIEPTILCIHAYGFSVLSWQRQSYIVSKALATERISFSQPPTLI
jgi:hypothetical protein